MASAGLIVTVLLTVAVHRSTSRGLNITICLDSSCDARIIIPAAPPSSTGDESKDASRENLLSIVVNNAVAKSDSADRNEENTKPRNATGDSYGPFIFLDHPSFMNVTRWPPLPQGRTTSSTAAPWWHAPLGHPPSRNASRMNPLLEGRTTSSTASPWWHPPWEHPPFWNVPRRSPPPQGRTTSSTASPWWRQTRLGNFRHSGGFMGLPTTLRPRYYDADDSGRRTVDMSGLFLTGELVRSALSRVSDEETRSVKELRLSRNLIRGLSPLTFPPGLEYGLRRLHLDHNQLRLEAVTRFELSRLHRLQELVLSFTDLRDLSEFPLLPELRVLDLSYNLLTSVPLLDRLPRLAVLRLSGNSILHLPPLASAGLQSLTDLSLNDNHLTWIADDAFHSMANLYFVDFSNNSLQNAGQVVRASAREVRLGVNPWHCDCALLSLTEHTPWLILDQQDFKILVEIPRPSTLTLVVLVTAAVVGAAALRRAWLKKRKRHAPLDLPYSSLDEKREGGV